MFRGYRPQPREEYVGKGLTNKSLETPDYEGVMFADGTVVVRWLTEFRSHSVWASWDDFYQVHGHPEYGTVIKWYRMVDEPETMSGTAWWDASKLPGHSDDAARPGDPGDQIRQIMDHIRERYSGPVQEEGWYGAPEGDAPPAEG